jgi:hypothetical protein
VSSLEHRHGTTRDIMQDIGVNSGASVMFDLQNLLAQLREERDALDAAISDLLESDLQHDACGFPSSLTKRPTCDTPRSHRPRSPVPGEK